MIKRLTIWSTALLILSLALVSGACAKEEAMPIPMPTPVPTPTPTPMPTPTPTPTPAPTPVAGQPWAERMIVRSGYMNVVVQDVAGAMEHIAQLAKTFSGYVVSSKTWEQGQRTVGTISIRVAAQYFDDVVKALRELAVEVTSESSSAEDVTEEYVDLESRLRNLEATETQLLKLIERAQTVDEALGVQRELTNIQGQIEQTKGRMQYLEASSATSLIEVHLEQAKLDVEFTAAKTRLNEAEEVQFTSQVAGGFAPHSYEWSFGDETTSHEKDPTHVYEAAGSYTVSLTVTDDKGNRNSETREEYITVVTRPGWSANKIARGAWHGLAAFGHVLGDVVIWVGIFGVIWVPILVIVYWRWRLKRK